MGETEKLYTFVVEGH